MQLGTKHTFALPDGREVSIETGKLAKQAEGSVVVRLGDCMLLATACAKADPIPGSDFMPLTVDYQEKYAAVGRFPGGFFKREARLSEYEILISRLIDRALRPMFPENFHADTQVMVTLISADAQVMPDCLAALAASAALTVSDIPFNGPISEVRVCRINGRETREQGSELLVRRRVHRLEAHFLEQPQHLQAVVHGLRAVVEAGEDVRMKIDEAHWAAF